MEAAIQSAEHMQETTYSALAGSELVRGFIAAFELATGVSLAIVPTDPKAIRIPLSRKPHPICSLVAGTNGGCEACRRFVAALQSGFGRNPTLHRERCFAGLVHVAVPLLVGGHHVATLVGGQVFLGQATRQDATRIARRLRGWGTEILPVCVWEACRQTRALTEEQLQAVEDLLSLWARLLAGESNHWMIAGHDGEPPRVLAAKKFIRLHACEPLNAHAVARHVGCSVRHLDRVMKRASGVTLHQYLATVRFEHAKALLASSNLQIKEIAGRTGFRYIEELDRVFRRLAGMSPRSYRASLAKR